MSNLPKTLDDKESLNFVLDFIKANGYLYEKEIKDCLEESKTISQIKRIVDKKRNMYERLSKL